MDSSNRIGSAILQVVETQMESNEPPEIKQTFLRLVAEGCAEQDAKELIGTVVLAEVFGVMKDGKPFNIERYAAALDKLSRTA